MSVSARRLRTFAALFAFSALCIGSASAQVATTSEGLVRRETPGIDVAYVLPGVDWRKYRTILILPLSIPPEARDGSEGRNASRGESFVLRDEDVADIQQAFDREMRDVFTRGSRYTIVTEPRSDTLVIATSILQLVLAAPIERTRMNYANRGNTFSSGRGGATLATTFADGSDYAILARVADNRYAPQTGALVTHVTSMANVRHVFEQWGKGIRERLEAIQDGAITPP